MVDGDALVETLPVAVAPQRASLWRDALRRFRRHRLAMIGTTVLLVMVVAVVAGPLAWRLPVNEIDFKQKLKGPTWSHPLGTDDLGQDLLARMLYGGRISLAVGVAAMLIAISLGTAIGAASGYMGGAVDHTLMRLTDLFLSIPALPLLLLIVYLFRDALKKAVGPEAGVFVLIVVVIGGLRWMPVARLVRAQFLSLREKEFVEAARGLGAPPLRPPGGASGADARAGARAERRRGRQSPTRRGRASAAGASVPRLAGASRIRSPGCGPLSRLRGTFARAKVLVGRESGPQLGDL